MNRIVLIFLLIVGIPFSCRKSVDNPYYRIEHTLEDSKADDSLLEITKSKGREVEYIFVHCTATPKGIEYTPRMAQKDWNRRGFNGVPGYHYMISLDGYVHILQPMNGNSTIDPGELVYGVRGYNSRSVHVAYVGGVIKSKGNFLPYDTRTEMQKRSMIELLDYLKVRFPNAQIVGHRECNPGKACPSFNVSDWVTFQLLSKQNK